MKRSMKLMLVLTALSMVTACGGKKDHDHDGVGAGAFEGVTKAICVLSPTTSTDLKDVSGTITFTETKDGLLVEWDVQGLKPNSKHGFHVHQWGNILKTDGKSTGGHYNPTKAEKHSLPKEHEGHNHSDTGGHAGDLGNLETDENGVAKGSKAFANISLVGNNAVVGRAIIVHLGEDKGIDEQPTGGAGPRVAQGVIGIADPDPGEDK